MIIENRKTILEIDPTQKIKLILKTLYEKRKLKKTEKPKAKMEKAISERI